jgi:hypothetical protein
MKIEIDVDIPEGWEFDRYDIPTYGEMILSMKTPWRWTAISLLPQRYIIVKKKKIVTEKHRKYIYKNIHGGYSVGILAQGNSPPSICEDYIVKWVDKDWITEEVS